MNTLSFMHQPAEPKVQTDSGWQFTYTSTSPLMHGSVWPTRGQKEGTQFLFVLQKLRLEPKTFALVSY
jgi:predicted SprT family Zn-dependent metalloprotease